MAKTKYISVSQAVNRAAELGVEVSEPTVRKWAAKYRLGRQLSGRGGKWTIDCTKWEAFIHGDQKTIPVKT